MASKKPAKKALTPDDKDYDPTKDPNVLMMLVIHRVDGEAGNLGMNFSIQLKESPRREVEGVLGLLSSFLTDNLMALSMSPAMGDKTPDGAAIPLPPKEPTVHIPLDKDAARAYG